MQASIDLVRLVRFIRFFFKSQYYFLGSPGSPALCVKHMQAWLACEVRVQSILLVGAVGEFYRFFFRGRIVVQYHKALVDVFLYMNLPLGKLMYKNTYKVSE